MCVHYNYNNFIAYEVSADVKVQYYGLSASDCLSQHQDNSYELHLEFAGLRDGDYPHPTFKNWTIIASDEKRAEEIVSHLIRLKYSIYWLHQASLRQYGSYGEIKFAKHMTQFDFSSKS